MSSIVAIDCDLRSITAVGGDGTVYASRELPSNAQWAKILAQSVVLFEVSGPAYARLDSRGAVSNQTRWAIYNAATAGMLYSLRPGLLVAPSSKWTKGYDVKTRHKLAQVTGRNKDIRECLAMIWFYRQNPTVWIPLPKYLEEL